MNRILTFCLLVFIFNNNVSAQNLELKPGLPRCEQEQRLLKLCTYTTQNIAARTLISRLNTVLFPNEPLDPREGFINRLTPKEITFWFNSPEMLARFLAILPQLDVLEDFTPGPLIAFESEVFAVTDEGLLNLQGSLGISNNGNATNAGGPGTGISASFGIGNFSLAVSLSGVLTKGQAHKVTTVRQILPNLSSLNFKHTSKIYVSPTPGQIQEQEVGIKISGELSLARNGDRRVLAHNYSLFYGVELKHSVSGSRVSVMEFSTPELVLDNGISHTLVSLNTFESSRTVGIGLPASFSSQKTRTKLLVITRAQAISYDEFIEENNRLRRLHLRTQFTHEEVNAFPANDVPLKDVLKAVKPYSHLTLSGEQMLGLHLDSTLARRSNYKQIVKVEIKAGKFKQTVVRSVEELMLNGIKLETLNPELTSKPIITFKVRFRAFPGFKLLPTQKLKLYYNPQTRQWM